MPAKGPEYSENPDSLKKLLYITVQEYLLPLDHHKEPRTAKYNDRQVTYMNMMYSSRKEFSEVSYDEKKYSFQ